MLIRNKTWFKMIHFENYFFRLKVLVPGWAENHTDRPILARCPSFPVKNQAAAKRTRRKDEDEVEGLSLRPNIKIRTILINNKLFIFLAAFLFIYNNPKTSPLPCFDLQKLKNKWLWIQRQTSSHHALHCRWTDHYWVLVC